MDLIQTVQRTLTLTNLRIGSRYLDYLRAKLEAAGDLSSDADLLLHVIDASSPLLHEQQVEVERVLEEIGAEYKGKLTVAKVDIDNNPMSPTNYAVRGIPTLILFKNGAVAAQKVGALSKSQLTAFLDSHL